MSRPLRDFHGDGDLDITGDKVPGFPIMQSLAAQYGASPHAVTLAWVRAQGKTVVPIPAATTPEHAIDSAKSAELILDVADLSAIDEAEFSRA